MMLTGLVPSKREARTIISQKGLFVNDVLIEDPNTMIAIDDQVIIRKGKKTYHKAKRV